MTKVLTVEGMMCGMCESHVADALRKVPGVQKASASRSKHEARVVCGPEVTDEALLAAVNATGYEASNVRAAADAPKKGLFGFRKK